MPRLASGEIMKSLNQVCYLKKKKWFKINHAEIINQTEDGREIKQEDPAITEASGDKT